MSQTGAQQNLDLTHRSIVPPVGEGQPLPEPIRVEMENRLGADFSAVRVHQGHEAVHLGAQAYTRGTDIHFAPGAYDPGSPQGRELIGHELAHVVQQRQGRVRPAVQL